MGEAALCQGAPALLCERGVAAPEFQPVRSPENIGTDGPEIEGAGRRQRPACQSLHAGCCCCWGSRGQ